jgi:hypothetical protein
MEICRKQIELGEDELHNLIYYVTVDDFTDDVSGIQLESYGVGITFDKGGDTAYIQHVTFSLTEIMKLSDLLAEHLVTPATIGDVVEDWLCA